MSFANKILSAVFILFISGLGILHFLVPDQGFSEQENRRLAQMPSISWESIFSGELMEEVEEYISDQFAFKEGWISWKARTEKILLKQDVNGLYLGDDGYLLEPVAEPGAQLDKNLELISYFSNKTAHLETYLLLVPTSIAVYPEKLPAFAQTYNQKKMIEYVQNKLPENIHFIEVLDQIKMKKDESIYFKTDHHWTMRGAYYAYTEAAVAMGIKPLSLEDFKIRTVASDFLGTFASKTIGHDHKLDIIEMFEPRKSISYEVMYDQKTAANSLFEWSFLDKKDKYSFFLNGNHSLVTIKSSIGNGKKLAVIKDSYSHAFIPFLTNHFEEIHVIDLRYFIENVYHYFDENNIQQVLFLYNLPNFTTDTNMYWLKR